MIGDGYAIQGNILTGPEVVEAMEAAWLDSSPEAPLAHRLLEALAAGDAAGGDSRGRQSAALLVVQDEAGYGGLDDIAVDLRVDDAQSSGGDPVTELARLLALSDLYLTASTEEEKVPVTAELLDELEELATGLGHRDFAAWVGTENYEMRVAADSSWIDVRILEIIRAQPGEAEVGPVSVLAIDAGTTGVTALVVEHDGRISARGYQEFAQHFPQAGLGRARARGDLAGDARGHPRRPEAHGRRRAAGDRHHQPARDRDAVGPRDARVAATRRSSGRTDVRRTCATACAPTATRTGCAS